VKPEKKILELLEGGPLRGKELHLRSGIPLFPLWRSCRLLEGVLLERAGRRYLRFDRSVPGFARLSPSVQREFTTYTVVGLARDLQALRSRARLLEAEIREISRRKRDLAQGMVEGILEEMGEGGEGVCFILAGDVPLGMAHSDPRPEASLGEMVPGSDIDLVAVASRGYPKDRRERLDALIYREKHRLLRRPMEREEIDYLIKDLGRVEEQTAFQTFEDRVACKILWEGRFLAGDPGIHQEVKALLEERGIPEVLRELEEEAQGWRERAETLLLEKEEPTSEELRLYFTTSDEFSEIF
jgi:hypothetical protein